MSASVTVLIPHMRVAICAKGISCIRFAAARALQAELSDEPEAVAKVLNLAAGNGEQRGGKEAVARNTGLVEARRWPHDAIVI